MSDYKRIEKLMLFVEVARELSFSKAAENLGMSKSYLSQQIKLLEQSLKMPLLVRTTRNVRLTPEGEMIMHQAEDLKRRMLDFENNLLKRADDVSGLIRLTAPKMFAESILQDLCIAFREQYPQVYFDILSSYRAFNLSETDVDFAFRATRNPPENMVAYHLRDYYHPLVAAPEYLQQNGTPSKAQDLDKHQCLTTMHQRNWPLESGDIKVSGWLSTNENRLLKDAVLSGKGITRIASYYVEKEIEQGKLSPVLEHETVGQVSSLYLLYPQLIYQSKKSKAFIEFVKNHFKP